jgi:hypothetical protein
MQRGKGQGVGAQDLFFEKGLKEFCGKCVRNPQSLGFLRAPHVSCRAIDPNPAAHRVPLHSTTLC